MGSSGKVLAFQDRRLEKVARVALARVMVAAAPVTAAMTMLAANYLQMAKALAKAKTWRCQMVPGVLLPPLCTACGLTAVPTWCTP